MHQQTVSTEGLAVTLSRVVPVPPANVACCNIIYRGVL